MRIIKAFDEIPKLKNAVITIGSFDGVHAGHQVILDRLHKIAESIDGETLLITFDPHPRHLIYPDDTSLKLLSTVKEKATLLKNYNLDNLFIVPFTKNFANQSPDQYIQHFLVKHFQPKVIVIGYDHRFGKNRVGDINYLKKFEHSLNYLISEIPKQEIDDITVSSTKVRKALQEGEIRLANQMLKHPFFLCGKVVLGKQLGKTIGFPTANLEVSSKHKLIPPVGVYVAKVFIEENEYGAMLYIGKSLDNPTESIEVNIFDFDEDIYGKELEVHFIDRIRGDIRFDGLEALKTQLEKDKIESLKVLEKKPDY